MILEGLFKISEGKKMAGTKQPELDSLFSVLS